MEDFETLLARHRGVLERFVRYRLPSTADAEDVIQETCLAAYRGFSGLKNPDGFKAWLLSIARNKCGDYFRRRAHQLEIPLETVGEWELAYGPAGLVESLALRETLSRMKDPDREMLYLHFLLDMPQADIARRLNLPLGTVKSRLHAARRRLRAQYDEPSKGDDFMSLPAYLPDYTITPSPEAPFPLRHEELPGMLIIPRLGEKRTFGMYDLPERKLTGTYALTVTGSISVHGVQGVEIDSLYTGDRQLKEHSTLYAQLTDTFCRYLGGTTTDVEGNKRLRTFLDEDFLAAYGIGPDNCGFPVERRAQGIIREEKGALVTSATGDVSDVVGRFTVKLGGRSHDTVRIIDMQEDRGSIMLCEYYVDASGRTVLDRRFNRNDWALDRYGKPWTELLPENERLTLNGETYVHWYDCISDSVL